MISSPELVEGLGDYMTSPDLIERVKERLSSPNLMESIRETLISSPFAECLDKNGDLTRYCRACGKKDDVKKCSKCKKVSYCGKECQKKDWKDHKRSCS